MIHWGERRWRSVKGKSYLEFLQPQVYSAEWTGNCAWGLNEELPIAAKSGTNKEWITNYTSLITVTGLILWYLNPSVNRTAVEIQNKTSEIEKRQIYQCHFDLVYVYL